MSARNILRMLFVTALVFTTSGCYTVVKTTAYRSPARRIEVVERRVIDDNYRNDNEADENAEYDDAVIYGDDFDPYYGDENGIDVFEYHHYYNYDPYYVYDPWYNSDPWIYDGWRWNVSMGWGAYSPFWDYCYYPRSYYRPWMVVYDPWYSGYGWYNNYYGWNSWYYPSYYHTGHNWNHYANGGGGGGMTSIPLADRSRHYDRREIFGMNARRYDSTVSNATRKADASANDATARTQTRTVRNTGGIRSIGRIDDPYDRAASNVSKTSGSRDGSRSTLARTNTGRTTRRQPATSTTRRRTDTRSPITRTTTEKPSTTRRNVESSSTRNSRSTIIDLIRNRYKNSSGASSANKRPSSSERSKATSSRTVTRRSTSNVTRSSGRISIPSRSSSPSGSAGRSTGSSYSTPSRTSSRSSSSSSTRSSGASRSSAPRSSGSTTQRRK